MHNQEQRRRFHRPSKGRTEEEKPIIRVWHPQMACCGLIIEMHGSSGEATIRWEDNFYQRRTIQGLILHEQKRRPRPVPPEDNKPARQGFRRRAARPAA